MLVAHKGTNKNGGMECGAMQTMANANKGGHEGTRMTVGEQWQEWNQQAAFAAATQQL